jgi:hypothetical protein
MLPPDEQKDARHDDWAMSKGVALGALTGLLLSIVAICVAYYFNWDDVRTMVHLVLE